MFVFPVIYISSFLAALYCLFRNKPEGILIFLICGLPIYTTTLSIVNMYGFPSVVPVLQSFKELLILASLGHVLYHYRGKLQLHLVDKLMLFFWGYTLLYVLVPLGQFGIVPKLLAFKSLSFFVLIYFTGRFFDFRKISINKNFRFICAVLIAATGVLFFELLIYQHLQTMTGYAEYNYRFFGQEASGNYDLSWTFEVVDIGRNPAKRFASFFSNPLEFAAATVLTTSILAALYTTEKNHIRVDSFGLVTFACTIFAIFFALSRASMLSYFLLIYVYAFLTGKRIIIRFIHLFFLAAALYIVFMVSKDVREFVVSTLNFSNLSSLGHVLEWLDGIQTMIASPLGIGLGESGRVAAETAENIGGESQLIILGVQVGVIALGVYIAVYVILMRQSYRWFKLLRGKERRLSLALLLMKTGFLVPLITSNFESYIYLSYIGWFFSGLFVAVIARRKVVSPNGVTPAASQPAYHN